MSSANTSDGLAHALPTSLPPGIGALLERYGPIAHLNDLRCEILRTSASLDVNGEPGVLRDTAVIVADLWGDGDLSMERHLTLLVSSGTAEAMPYPFTERWSRVDGDVLYCQSGGEMATVYPERNGAGSFIAQSDMLDGQRLSQWLTDPFEFSRSGSPWVGPAYDDAGFARYERRRHGGYDHLIVDEGVSTAPLVRELRHHSLSGALLRRVMFDDERDVLPGAPRPMLMVEEILGGEGTVVEAIEYRFSGRPDVLAQEPEVELPEPLSDVWSIWVR